MKHALRIAGFCPLYVSLCSWRHHCPRSSGRTPQKDVWKSVEDYWALDAKGDLEGFMSYFDASYVGWSYDSPARRQGDGEEVHRPPVLAGETPRLRHQTLGDPGTR